MLRETADDPGIASGYAMVYICLRDIGSQDLKQRKIDRTQGPKEIRKRDFRVIPVVKRSNDAQTVLPHQQIVEGVFLPFKKSEHTVPIDLLIHNQRTERRIVLIRQEALLF